MHQILLANIVKNSVSWLIGPLDSVLRWLHASVGLSWGLAIITLTVLVRLMLVPLTYKQITSMIHMQQFQPQIKEINEKYKEDPQRKQQELMAFFKEHQINPLASCLPLLFQMPLEAYETPSEVVLKTAAYTVNGLPAVLSIAI